MNILASIGAFLIIFSLIIFVHEFGHFAAAKKAGIKVHEFGFGMPPRIWGKKKGETTYSINAIPFGGFVRMLGEDISDPQAKKSSRSYLNKSIRWRMVVAVAGVVMNLLLAFFCLTVGFWIGIEPLIVSSDDFMEIVKEDGVVMENGTSDEEDVYLVALPRPAVYNVADGSMAEVIGFEDGDVILEVDDEQVFYISEFKSYGYADSYKVWRDGAEIDLSGMIVQEEKAVVSYVISGTPADEVGLQVGDLILSIQDRAVIQAVDVFTITSEDDSEVLAYVVDRDGEFLEFDIERGEGGYVGIYVGNVDYEENLGLDLYDSSLDATIYEIKPVRYGWSAPVESVKELYRLGVLTAVMVKDLFGDLIMNGEISDGVAGPVGIAQMTYTFVQQGFAAVIRFIALLSLSLAVFNIIPFPALDGGRFAFLLFEAVTGRKPNQKLEATLHGLGFMLLMLLLVVVTFKDVGRFFS